MLWATVESMAHLTLVNDSAYAHPMRHGVVAMVDALGFRGIWNRLADEKKEDEFIAAVRALQEEAQVTARLWSPPSAPIGPVRAAGLSDTIVITIATAPASGNRNIDATALDFTIAVAVRLVKQIMRRATEAPIGLAYRGCVTIGKCRVEDSDRIVMGPAIDEAAELHQRAQGMFVWLTPEALRAANAVQDGHTNGLEAGAVEWSVPLKLGDPYRTRVVSPFEADDDEKRRAALKESLLATFEHGRDRLDVAIKRQQTEAFLDHAMGVGVRRPAPLPSGLGGPGDRS